MKIYTTKIKAICPFTNKLRTYFGPNVQGNTIEEAQQYCEENGIGYCKVFQELVKEVSSGSKEKIINNNLN